MSEPYRLVLMPSAIKALETELKPSVAFALYEFMDTVLLDAPRRVGKPLAKPLDGYLSARRGAYRVIYRIDDKTHSVMALTVDHRADVYRPR